MCFQTFYIHVVSVDMLNETAVKPKIKIMYGSQYMAAKNQRFMLVNKLEAPAPSPFHNFKYISAFAKLVGYHKCYMAKL